jgi:adenylate cyclase
MPTIFLSYAREDAKTASALAAALETRGFKVWWDQHISGGRRFAAEIERALAEADAVVVMWSSAARVSPWVQDEASIGRDAGRLVPVRLDDQQPPIGFRQFQAIDFSGGKRSKLPKVADAIVRAIAELGVDGPNTEERAAEGGYLRKVREWRWVVAAVAVLLLGVMAYLAWPARSEVPSVRVVVARGGEPSLTAGIARNLTNDLQRLQQARSERFTLLEADSGTHSDIEIDVAANSAGQGAQVNVSLKRDAQILWSDVLEARHEQRSDIRQQVVAKVAAVLNCALDARTADGERADPTTLKLYLRACDAVNFDRSTGAPDRVVATLEQVTARNPNLPAAWALLAQAQFFAGRGHSAVRKSIARARALDSNNALTFVTEILLVPSSSFAEVMRIADRGVAVAPSDSSVRSTRAGALAAAGRTAEAINEARVAVSLDPLSMDSRQSFIMLLAEGGRVDEALGELDKAEQTWPGELALRQQRFNLHLRYGDPKVALRILDSAGAAELQPFSPFVEVENAHRAFLKARITPTAANIDAAVEAYRRIRADEAFKRAAVLQTLVAFGRTNQAVPLLQDPAAVKQWKEGSDFLFRATLKPLWKKREFFDFMASVGLVDFWRSTAKWPDFCRDPQLPYDCAHEAERIRKR